MMKTIPSLVASSTVGIAPVGLAFGKPERSTPPRPSSKKRKVGDLAEVVIHNQGASPLTSRPGTSSTAITPDTKAARPATSSISNPTPTLRPRASTIRVEAQHNTGRRHSIFKHDEVPSGREHSEEDTRRESISSRGSWMRRLSIIPNSRDNSPRSSLGPDSPSFSIFNGPAAPILSSPANSAAQLPPNKLVKRGSTIRQHSGPASTSWTGSKSQVPTLRRPATSHQRSITLQQQFRDNSMSPRDGLQQIPNPEPRSTPVKKISTPESRHAWRLYFDSRPTKLTKDKPSTRASDEGTKTSPSSSKRVMPDENARPTLVTPDMITTGQAGSTGYYYDDSIELDETLEEVEVPDANVVQLINSSTDANKRPRRSLSMHFSSPSSWISRSGSLRGNKRNPDGRSGGKRFASAPLPSTSGESNTPGHDIINDKTLPTMDHGVLQRESKQKSLPGASVETGFQPRGRTSSSPLPPLSRFSTFNMRSELSVLPTTATTTGNTSLSSTGHTSPSSVLNFDTRQPKPHRVSEVGDRASTLIGSDNEVKGFASGDEDDMDFQSETVYDSLRSGATGSLRSHNAQLDLMFEESPPSVNGHTKSKRLSIHEMLNNGGFSEGNNRILEEDEGMSTPVKSGRVPQERSYQTPVRMDAMEMDEAFPSSPPSFCLATKDFGRLSLDDEEEDEDWTRDEENGDMSGQLSPPSSTVNSRKVSPSIRAALADVTHSGSTNGNPFPTDRPKSNLFDWSEPPAEKDYMGNSSRPRTAHVKHIADIRGGRTVGRKGPSALHVRSQSVPVVPDVAGQRDHSKLTPKFGTWGLGAKGVSEDWDNDFEFENDSNDEIPNGENKLENSGMFVPKAIQASQASVVGHVGQIREVCLLVEDLKRLRLLAREKGILNGPSAHLWKEAEGIIALAVPDEEDLTLSPPGSPSSIMFEREISDDDYHERGLSVEDLEIPDAPFEVLNRHGKPTGFVSDGRTVRRRSVFSGDDDIFGAGTIDMATARDHLRPPSVSTRNSSMKTSSEIARSVMETMHQHRSTSDPLLQKMINQSPNKMPFDTTSLRDLVNRASNLSRALAELIRKADGGSESPKMNDHRDSSPAFTRVFSDPPGSSRGLDNNTHRDSSPAFTRVFDPSASSPKNLSRSHSNNSMLSGSIDNSPTRLGQRLHMMTVV